MRHRGRAILAAVAAVALVATAGCQLTRQNFQAVSIGQSADEVQKVLGAPRYQFGGEWVWTSDDPRDLTKAAVYFDAEKKVVGKSWQNPEKPWENLREGQVPQP
jgi:outer membrane protein assembly factor BamE (lipoprotein component of BamABCDE complex)